MLKILSLVLMVAFIFQLIIVGCVDVVSPYSNSYIDILSVESITAILLLVYSLSSMFYITNKHESLYKMEPYNGSSNEESKILILGMILLSCIGIWTVYSTPKFVNAITLNGSQEVENVGLLFKMGTTFIPALSLAAFSLFPMKRLSWLMLFGGIILSAYVGSVFLTKQPIFPFLIFLLSIYSSSSRKLKVIILTLLLLVFSSVLLIYITRENSQVGYNALYDSLYKIFFRFILYMETIHIVDFLYFNKAFLESGQPIFSHFITSNVFNRDSLSIGIAPGYLGYFLLSFGYLGLVFVPMFTYISVVFISFLRGNTVIERIVYFILVCELLSFFNDGNPTFYNSTSHSALFYFMMIVSILLIIIRKVK